MSTAVATAREVSVNWSRWFHCESSFDLSLVPSEPGIYSVAEELTVPNQGSGLAPKRTLSIVKVQAVDDLLHALNALFASGCPIRERLVEGRCFVRYGVVADPVIREKACAALEAWLNDSGNEDSPVVREFESVRTTDSFHKTSD